MKKKLIIIGLIFTAVTIASRLLPHVPNMTPVAALALFSAVYMPRKWSLAVPLLAMLVSDIFIGFYEWQVVLSVYLGFIITVVIGWQLKKVLHPVSIASASLAGSVIFFLLTNAAVWAFTQMYPHTLSGLMTSYAMAIPFFKFSLLGDLAWTVAFFGAYQLLSARYPLLSLTAKKLEIQQV